jgi:short-subunit dehydrogenase
MRVNYDGAVHVVHATLPKMVARRRGALVCFGSVAGNALTPRLGAYCASKAAVNAYVEILAHETAATGVRVHLVCPPMVDTPLLQQSLASSGPRSLTQAIERKMLATPDQVLDAVEKGLARGEWVSYPLATAKALHAMRRFAPGLLWKVIQKAEDEAARATAS